MMDALISTSGAPIATPIHTEDSFMKVRVFSGHLTDADRLYLDAEINKCIDGIRQGFNPQINRLEIRELIDASNTANGLGLFQMGRRDGELIYIGMFVQYKIPKTHINQYRKRAELIVQYITQKMQDKGFFLIQEPHESDDILLRSLTFGGTHAKKLKQKVRSHATNTLLTT